MLTEAYNPLIHMKTLFSTKVDRPKRHLRTDEEIVRDNHAMRLILAGFMLHCPQQKTQLVSVCGSWLQVKMADPKNDFGDLELKMLGQVLDAMKLDQDMLLELGRAAAIGKEDAVPEPPVIHIRVSSARNPPPPLEAMPPLPLQDSSFQMMVEAMANAETRPTLVEAIQKELYRLRRSRSKLATFMNSKQDGLEKPYLINGMFTENLAWTPNQLWIALSFLEMTPSEFVDRMTGYHN